VEDLYEMKDKNKLKRMKMKKKCNEEERTREIDSWPLSLTM